MSPKTFILMGRSGCGKGTQASLLEKTLAKITPEREIVHLETGKLFRDFVRGTTFTSQISKQILDSGGLQPEFLTVHLWAGFLIGNMQNDSHLIIDGTPRRLDEAGILNTACQFYNRNNPHIIYLNVSREWSQQRMLERKRNDDTKQDIELRLNWFDTEVVPALEYYRKNSFYSFHEIDGERSIEEIQKDIDVIALA